MNHKKTFIIVGAGSLCPGDLDFTKSPEDFLCAADAGLLPLREKGLVPDLIVGDFDSMPEKEVFSPASGASSADRSEKGSQAPEIIRLPVEKDDTDIVYCVREGFRRGYRDFLILGALGGARLSHSFANIQLLSFVRSLQGTAVLRFGKTALFLLSEGEEKHFPPAQQAPHQCISVFSLSDSAEVTLQGLYYPLDHGRITRDFPLGVSNHFTGEEACIRVHHGDLLIIIDSGSN